MSYLKVTCLAMSILTGLMQAEVEVRDNGIRNNNLFGITFEGSEQSFYGKVASVNSASLQEYLSGPYMVTEMVIDMEGGTVQLRIYQTELLDPSNRIPSTGNPTVDGIRQRVSSSPPAAVQRLTEQGRSVHNQAIGDMVVKEYPSATHARTLEFRIAERETLLELYNRFIDRYTQRNMEAAEGQRRRGLAGTLFTVNPRSGG